ncbi:MAG: glucose-6-phosphate dehydrogenase [Alphaproteobacteria bacterium]|nr:glucose-6-phosphate dehydrogenase [Alphaproteobacteria bacterium]
MQASHPTRHPGSPGSSGFGAALPPTALVAPCDIVVFGGGGDLALRKLLPALLYRDADGQLTADSRIIAVGRSPGDTAGFRARVAEALHRHAGEVHEAIHQGFLQRVVYLGLDATDGTALSALAPHLSDQPGRVRAFYLATAPDLFGPIAAALATAGLVTPDSRVVLEKPLGRDLASSCAINDAVGAVFSERQTFRIDHYLGKETVQNLLVLRFANVLFEHLWSHAEVDHVQITVAETLGVEGRAGYYDQSGALRDMVQNHLLQLLCLIAMEPPASLDQDAVRDEKLKVLRTLRPIRGGDVAVNTVRGQYRAGAVAGLAVPGYAEELGQDSATETFVAIKAQVETWRWAGVPFYLRTGKRLADRTSEIVLQFRPVPHVIFPQAPRANRLVIRLQPDEGIRLHLMAKEPGPGGVRLKDAALNLSFAETFSGRLPDAYERLLMDVVRGNPTLFMRRDEVEAAWRWVEPILAGWAESGERPKPYPAGSWGPSAAVALIERDGRTWAEDIG